jgi:enoyl-CoA hydratase/carnithine racemase
MSSKRTDTVTPYGNQRWAEGAVLADFVDGVGLITFNRPEKQNAMSVEMWEALARILHAFSQDPLVRVVVITGAGSKAFVSGADISQLETRPADPGARQEYDRCISTTRTALADFPKPVIARIRGHCVGIGVGLALQADLRIAGVDSHFGLSAARLGIAYPPDLVRRLMTLVGPANARMLLYTGATIDAREAERIGLINRAVPDEDLSEAVVELARTIADNAPLSVAAAKVTITEMAKNESARDLKAVERGIAACLESEDYREGRTAFLDKRAPRFSGS